MLTIGGKCVMKNISTEELKKYLNAMVVLDIIMVPQEDDWLRLINAIELEQGYGYKVDNGSGDRLTVIFATAGVLIKGFDHENELNQFAADEWDNEFFEYTYNNVPAEFIDILTEDDRDETTFCMWCVDGTNWIQNEMEGNDGGKEYLLGYICHNAKEWCEWAEAYYEVDINEEVVEKTFLGEQLTEEDVVKLNPKCDVKEVLAEIGRLKK